MKPSLRIFVIILFNVWKTKDSIIPRTGNPAYQRLTRKAIDILDNGGYAKFINDQMIEKAHQEQIVKYTYRIQFSIAIATGIAAVYYFIEIIHRLLFWCY